MAVSETDKLINKEQGERIISALQEIGQGSRSIPTPVPVDVYITYDGTEKSLQFTNVDPDRVNVYGDIGVMDIGHYETTCSLKKLSDRWDDGTTNPKTYAWSITAGDQYSFGGSPDELFVELIAKADAGEIDLYEDLGWRVGDERTVTLSAMPSTGVGESHETQDATFVILDRGVDQTYVLSNNITKRPNFIVGLKNCLVETGYMNDTNTNNGSWSSSKRRAWCNNVFRNAIPSTLRSAFKQVKCITAETYNGTTLQTTDDYFMLPAAAEVFKGDPTYGTGGSEAGQTTAYSNLTEFRALKRFAYFATTSNRIKKLGDIGSASIWWERSPRFNAGNYFCFVGTGGRADGHTASTTNGLSPFGCL